MQCYQDYQNTRQVVIYLHFSMTVLSPIVIFYNAPRYRRLSIVLIILCYITKCYTITVLHNQCLNCLSVIKTCPMSAKLIDFCPMILKTHLREVLHICHSVNIDYQLNLKPKVAQSLVYRFSDVAPYFCL